MPTQISSNNNAQVGVGTLENFTRFFSNTAVGAANVPIYVFQGYLADASNVIINANVVAGSNTAADDATWLIEINRHLEYKRIVRR
jgi:hypothetical protein